MSHPRMRMTCGAVLAIVTLLAMHAAIPHRAAAQDERTPEEWGALRQQSFSNLKMIMIAMHTYHDTYKSFPAAYVSKDDKPLLSWRVALLPFLETPGAEKLYDEFHMDEPWDSDHNKPLIAKMPAVYRAPSSQLEDGRTVYLTPRSQRTIFSGAKGTSMRKIIDGTSRTIALVEVDDAQAVPWTKPDDWPFDTGQPKVGFRGQYPNGLAAAMCDGSAHFLGLDVDDETLKALFTMDGREVVEIPRK